MKFVLIFITRVKTFKKLYTIYIKVNLYIEIERQIYIYKYIMYEIWFYSYTVYCWYKEYNFFNKNEIILKYKN